MAETLSLTPLLTVGTPDNEVFTVRFDAKDHYLAAGGYDGRVRIYSVLSGQLHLELTHTPPRTEYENVPIVTSVRWRPNPQMTRNILFSTHTDGVVNCWYPGSGRLVYQLREETDIYALDTAPDGSYFATGSSDFQIRLYDAQRHQSISVLVPHGPNAPGHSSRVFALKFTADSSVLLSGGWDSTVHIWDVRARQAVGALLGPYICGDALDVQEDLVLAGSWQPKRQIQLFSMRMRAAVSTIDWKSREDQEDSHVYAVQFSKHGRNLVLAGGSRSNAAKLFAFEPGYKPLASIEEVPKAVYSVEFAHNSEVAVLGCGDGCIRLFEYKFLS